MSPNLQGPPGAPKPKGAHPGTLTMKKKPTYSFGLPVIRRTGLRAVPRRGVKLRIREDGVVQIILGGSLALDAGLRPGERIGLWFDPEHQVVALAPHAMGGSLTANGKYKPGGALRTFLQPPEKVARAIFPDPTAKNTIIGPGFIDAEQSPGDGPAIMISVEAMTELWVDRISPARAARKKASSKS